MTPIPLQRSTIGSDLVQTVNARDLHEFLGSSRHFTVWIANRIDSYGFVEDVDFCLTEKLSKTGSGGHNKSEYHLSLDMAKQLAMVERTEKGREARLYFIECERRANDPKLLIADLKARVKDGIEAEKQLIAMGAIKPALRIGTTKREPLFNVCSKNQHRMSLRMFLGPVIMKPVPRAWMTPLELSGYLQEGVASVWDALYQTRFVDHEGWPINEADWMRVEDGKLLLWTETALQEMRCKPHYSLALQE